jgi:hypothetical protein
MRQGYDQDRPQRGQVNLLRLLGWRGWLALAVAATLLVVTLLVAASIFLILLPVVLLTGIITRLVYGWRRGRRSRPAAAGHQVIEGSYEVIAEGRSGPGQPADARSDAADAEPSRPGRGWGPR